jgi:hypothetical protein
VFGGFTRQIDLNQQLRRAASFGGRRIELRDQLGAVDRLNRGKGRPCLSGLVRLQVAEQMPPD